MIFQYPVERLHILSELCFVLSVRALKIVSIYCFEALMETGKFRTTSSVLQKVFIISLVVVSGFFGNKSYRANGETETHLSKKFQRIKPYHLLCQKKKSKSKPPAGRWELSIFLRCELHASLEPLLPVNPRIGLNYAGWFPPKQQMEIHLISIFFS